MEKRERGSDIIFPIILRQMGRISIGEKVKWAEMSVKKIQIEKNRGGKEHQVVWKGGGG